MSLTRRIAHNTAIQIVGKVASTVLGLIVIGLVARHLGQDGYGLFVTVQTFPQFFGVVVDFGLYIVLVKRLGDPTVDKDAVVSNIFTLRLISAVTFLGLAPLAVIAFPYPDIVKIGVALTTLSILFVTLNQVLIGVFQAHLRMDRVAIAELAGRFVLLGTTVAVVALDLGLLAVLWTVALGSLANFLVTLYFVRRLIRLQFRVDIAEWRAIIRESWPIAVSIALNLIYFRADTLILSLTKPAGDVGIYGATYKVLEVLTTFPAMFAGLVLPLLSAAWAVRDRARFQRLLQRSVDFLALLAFPLVVGTAFVAEPVMVFVAGEEFRASGGALRIIMIATGAIFLGNLFGNAVVALERQRRMVWIYLAVAVTSLGANLLFIPSYSYHGAAWVRVASEVGIMLGSAVLVLRTSGTRLRWGTIGKVTLATGVMAAAIALLPTLPFVATIGVGGIVYVLALFLFRAVDRSTIREVFRLS